MDRPLIDVDTVSLKRICKLSHQMPHAGTDLQKPCAAPSIAARQTGVEAIRPPIHTILRERNLRVGMSGKIIFVERHGLFKYAGIQINRYTWVNNLYPCVPVYLFT